MITLTLTSCGRFDLLEKTLRTLFRTTRYQFEKVIIHEDSGDADGAALIQLMFPQAEFIVSNRIGLSASWDLLLSKVETPLVFTCEDDWIFNGNSMFMENSLRIIHHNPDIHHVWIRKSNDHQHPLSRPVMLSGVSVQRVLHWQGTDWNGFSMNPGLRRMSDLKRMFPNGLSEFGDEMNCARHVKQFDYKAVALTHGACKHIGDGRHTQNFKV